MKKIYAVAVGRKVGIYLVWEECKMQVNGFPGAQYKSFSIRDEAEKYLSTTSSVPIPVSSIFPLSISVVVDEMKTRIYTDGSYYNKEGGYGVRITHPNGDIQEDYGHLPIGPNGENPTNQRAELYAIQKALELTKGDVVIYSDSMYSIRSMTVWIKEWKKNGWKTSKGSSVLNQDLVKTIHRLSETRNVDYIHVLAHTGIADNERVDVLANQGRMMTKKKIENEE